MNCVIGNVEKTWFTKLITLGFGQRMCEKCQKIVTDFWCKKNTKSWSLVSNNNYYCIWVNHVWGQ